MICLTHKITDRLSEMFKEYSQPFRQKLQAQMHNTSPLTPSQGEENAAIIRRQHNLDNHYSNCLARLYQSPLNQAPQIIDELVNTAPELDEDAKQRFTQAIKPYRDEVAYLVNNLSFRNIQFWRDGIPSE